MKRAVTQDKKGSLLLGKARQRLANMKTYAKKQGCPIEPSWLPRKSGVVTFLKDVGPPPTPTASCVMRRRALGYVRGNVVWEDRHLDGKEVHRETAEERKFRRDLTRVVDVELVRFEDAVKAVYKEHGFRYDGGWWHSATKPEKPATRPEQIRTGKEREYLTMGGIPAPQGSVNLPYIVLKPHEIRAKYPTIHDLAEAIPDNGRPGKGPLDVSDCDVFSYVSVVSMHSKSDAEVTDMILDLRDRRDAIQHMIGGYVHGASPTNLTLPTLTNDTKQLGHDTIYGAEARDIETSYFTTKREEEAAAAELREVNRMIQDGTDADGYDVNVEEILDAMDRREILRMAYAGAKKVYGEAAAAKKQYEVDAAKILRMMYAVQDVLDRAVGKLEGLMADRRAKAKHDKDKAEREAALARVRDAHGAGEVAAIIAERDATHAELEAMVADWDEEEKEEDPFEAFARALEKETRIEKAEPEWEDD